MTSEYENGPDLFAVPETNVSESAVIAESCKTSRETKEWRSFFTSGGED